MNTSGIEILSGQHNAEQRNVSALQLRDRNALNFGLVLFKDRDELFVARIRHLAPFAFLGQEPTAT
jgi:hypothetical protein